MTSSLLKTAHLVFAGVLTIVYLIVFSTQSWLGALFCALFIWPPVVIDVLISYRAKQSITQGLLLLTTLGYAGWAVYLYVDAMVIHVDPQSAIVLLFTGIYAAPFLLPLWLFCLGIELWAQRRG